MELLQVYESSFTETGIREEVALKVIDIPSSIHDPCYQVRADDLPSPLHHEPVTQAEHLPFV